LLGLVGLLALLAAFALLDPVLVTAVPARQDLFASLVPIGGDFLLRADQHGRRLLARLAYGARLSFGMALLTMLRAPVPGLLLGVLAAWRGVMERALVALSELDPVHQMEVAGMLRQASERHGLVILFVTRDTEMAARVADRSITLRA
jgi:ABC-type dipeptide/oligopeptide/nickel transport system permease subunit